MRHYWPHIHRSPHSNHRQQLHHLLLIRSGYSAAKGLLGNAKEFAQQGQEVGHKQARQRAVREFIEFSQSFTCSSRYEI